MRSFTRRDPIWSDHEYPAAKIAGNIRSKEPKRQEAMMHSFVDCLATNRLQAHE